MKNNIVFTNTFHNAVLDKPLPASNFVPSWYKDMQSYIGGEKKPDGYGNTDATIKRCMPVFDAITAGYIITLPADVYVRQTENGPHYEWSSLNLLEFHSVEQAPNHPGANGFSYPKFINPWSIRTPKGYSTLFVQPMHRDAKFTILPGVVDTDEYFAPVNFPFVLNDLTFEGMIPKGTPIAQVIPFKRESWEIQYGKEEEYKEQQKITLRLATKFFDRYKSMFRQSKEYK